MANTGVLFWNEHVIATRLKPNLTLNLSPIMHSAYPMHMSYDVYTFIYSLMREPTVLQYLKNIDEQLPEFKKILIMLFYSDDLQTIISDLLKLSETSLSKDDIEGLRSLSNIVKDLSDLKIKFKINIDDVYKSVGLVGLSVKNEQLTKTEPLSNQNKYIYLAENIDPGFAASWVTGKSHICTSICTNTKDTTKKGECKTNKYSEAAYMGLSTEYYEKGTC
jgi:hypothetical protein